LFDKNKNKDSHYLIPFFNAIQPKSAISSFTLSDPVARFIAIFYERMEK
jgi:hypothetical protein